MLKNKISLNEARKLALYCQLLDNKTKPPDSKEGIAWTIDNLGYVQIDTIAVIERAHHHTLWTRCPDYDREWLHQLQAVDRRVFEYWGHAASYLPMSDYRFYLPRMKDFANPHSKWEKDRLAKYGHMLQPVLERIVNEGPLSSKDFEPPPERSKGGWWDWQPAKVALEMLFWQGRLMITERRKFQRVYDLTERVLPNSIDLSYPGEEELGRFLVKRALAAYGVASLKEIIDHLHAGGRDMMTRAVKEMMSNGEIIEVVIADIKGGAYYILPENLEKTTSFKTTAPKLYILSPFDNLIIQRDRTLKLFGFDYALECYTPPAKRVHGYFVLPILYGDKFAGRLDPKADRPKKTFIIRNLLLEKGFKPDDSFYQAFAEKLAALAQFNNCDNISFEKVNPTKLKGELSKRIKRII